MKDLNYYGYAHEQKPEARFRLHQQREERGFDDTELWNLDVTFCRFMLPRLKAFKSVCLSHPSDITFDEWQKILSDIIEGFEMHVDAQNHINDDTKFDTAMSLFCEFVNHLWI